MKPTTYKASVNEQFEFDASAMAKEIDLVPDGNGQFHVLMNQKAYQATVVDTNHEKKQFTINVNGHRFDVQLEDAYDQLINELGFAVASDQLVNDVKAPMPGLVLDVLVELGQTVEKGEGLIILEAMKMENIIKAAGAGVVKAVHVGKGKAVDKGVLLIEME